MTDRHRALLSLAVFILWAATTAFLSRLWEGQKAPEGLNDSVAGCVQPSYLVAIILLLLSVRLFGWRDVGLSRPPSWSSVRYLWFPALYVAAFLVGCVIVGLPPVAVLSVIAINTFLVGFSEELACRGILFQGLLGTFGIRKAILLSTTLFGSVHLLNGFTTGDFAAAAVQSLTAFMSGMTFLAVRIRTGSLLPAIVLHALWDCALITLATTAQQRMETAGQTAAPVMLPLLLILPNFIYGLFLLRRYLSGRGEGDSGIAGPVR